MSNEDISIYTDVSYDHIFKIGVIVFKIINNLTNIIEIITMNIDDLKNTQLELKSIDLVLEKIKELNLEGNIVIYTDCQSSVKKECPFNIKIQKIKAHKKKSDCDNIELEFREIDILSRKILRLRRKSVYV